MSSSVSTNRMCSRRYCVPCSAASSTVVACHQVRGGEPVDETGNRVGFLPVVAAFCTRERQRGSVIAKVDRPARKLRAEVEVAQRSHLVDPPLGFLEAAFVRGPANEDEPLCFEGETILFGIEDTVREQVSARHEHLVDGAERVEVRLVEIVDELGRHRPGEVDVEGASVIRLEAEPVTIGIESGDIPGDRVREGERTAHWCARPYGGRHSSAKCAAAKREKARIPTESGMVHSGSVKNGIRPPRQLRGKILL